MEHALPPKRFQFTLRQLAIAFLLYAFFWTLTATWGCTQLKNALLNRDNLVSPDEQVLDYNPTEEDWVVSRRQRPKMPWRYACNEFSPFPFLVRVDHGMMVGELAGSGQRTFFFWFFGMRYRVWQSLEWNS